MNKPYRITLLLVFWSLVLSLTACAGPLQAPVYPTLEPTLEPAPEPTAGTAAEIAPDLKDDPAPKEAPLPTAMPSPEQPLLAEATAEVQQTLIAYGETRRGAITASNRQETWEFAGRAGDAVYVAVEATSGDFDAVVDIFTVDGRSILPVPLDTYFDEHWQVSLPETGTYRLDISSFRGTEGDYELSIAAVNSLSLRTGETRRGGLDAATPVEVWTIYGDPQATVTVEASADDDLDLHVIFLGSFAQEQLFLVDSSFGPERVEVEIPASGTFQVGIAEHNGRAGAYTLALESAPVTRPATALELGEIWVASISTSDRITPHGDPVWGHIYRLDAHQNQTAIFDIDTEDGRSTLDSVLEFYDEDWNLLAQNDDDGRSLDSYLTVTFPYTGHYFLVVRAFGGSPPSASDDYEYALTSRVGEGEGRYAGLDHELPALRSRSLYSDGNPEPFPIYVDVPRGETDAGAADLGRGCYGWTTYAPYLSIHFRGEPAELRFSFVPVDAVDATLIVRDPTGTWHCNDDAGFGLNPTVLVQNPVDGQYDVWIGTFSRRAIAGEVILQEPSAGTLTADNAPVGVQTCGFTNGGHGNISVGSLVSLGRHRTVAGDANWSTNMDSYVGLTAVVTALEAPDDAGCPVVRVDRDDGLWYWRVRDLQQPE